MIRHPPTKTPEKPRPPTTLRPRILLVPNPILTHPISSLSNQKHPPSRSHSTSISTHHSPSPISNLPCIRYSNRLHTRPVVVQRQHDPDSPFPPPKKTQEKTARMCTSDIFLGLIAILFPPIAVWIKRSICSADSLINILLCTLGYIPGLLHAWYIIAAYPEPHDDYEALPGDGGEAPRVTYYYVNRRDVEGGGPPPARREQRGYGTTEGRRGQAQGEGSAAPQEEAGGVPPSYEQAIRGDHKVQT